jgi:soluble lytic murein transglycosylase
LARSHEELGHKEESHKLYEVAARKYGYIFYGQAANLKLGRTRLHLPGNINIEAALKDAPISLRDKQIAEEVRIVAKYGGDNLARTYITGAVKEAKGKNSILVIAKALKGVNNTYYKVCFAKKAAARGVFLKNYAYPTPYKLIGAQIEPALIYSIIRQESVFDSKAVSCAKAKGLMQIIHTTACETARKIGAKCEPAKLNSHPEYNIKLGSNHLREMIERYNGSIILAFGAYNAGPQRIDKWLKTYGDPRKTDNIDKVIDWLELIPFGETRNYVQRVLENLQVYRTVLNKNGKFKLKQDLTLGKEV